MTDRNYLVYGSAWFSGKVEAGSEEEARFMVISELLNDAGIAIKIESIEVEVDDQESDERRDNED